MGLNFPVSFPPLLVHLFIQQTYFECSYVPSAVPGIREQNKKILFS